MYDQWNIHVNNGREGFGLGAADFWGDHCSVSSDPPAALPEEEVEEEGWDKSH